ncbi:MAG: SH3 domain-containing protein [Clostridiales bacterium]|nr:SH3 domain-containing protein [Clostridiales bacterium]
MKKRFWRRGLALALGLVLGLHTAAVSLHAPSTAYAYTARSATVGATTLNVRSGAGTSYDSVAKLAKGTAITVVDETTGTDGNIWYQIRFTGSGGTQTTGYVLSSYVSFPVSYNTDSSFEAQLSAQGFPESYKDSLRQLHAQYPNWTFTAYQTGLDWETVIENESVLGRNLVSSGSISSFKSTADGAYNWDTGTWVGFDGSSWVAASEDVIRYYMDPRNFLDSIYIYQFMSQSYDSSIHTREGLVSMLSGTFMEGSVTSSGSASVSTTTDTGSTDSSSGTSSPVVGPGVSSSAGSSTSATPSGQSAVVVMPGASSDDTSAASTGTTEMPAVSIEGPSASISRHETSRVAESAVITAGQGSGGVSAVPGGVSQSLDDSDSSGASQNVTLTGSTSYADIIMNAAASSGVSPYVIAAMIIQEQGSDGHGNSISGTYSGYSGYYNYFNIGAYASDGMTAVERGLWYASQSGSYNRPWTSPEASIIGGAMFYGTNYVSAGQNTLYLKKFNVQGENIYKHQYMTYVEAAASEGSIYGEGFSDAVKNTALNFSIPVYSNMPETACALPTADGSPNNRLSSLTVDGFTLTPTFAGDTESYNLIVDTSVSSVTVRASAVDSGAAVSGAGVIAIQDATSIPITVTAENGSQRTYMIYVARQSGGSTYSGSAAASSDTGSSVSTESSPVVGPGVSTTPAADTTSASESPSVSLTPETGVSPGSDADATSGGSSVVVIGPG